MNKNNFIQVLRALAALLVVIDHSSGRFIQDHLSGAVPPVVYLAGAVGVQIFFCISGYIIYVTSFKHHGIPGYAPGFLLKRFIRVWPLYALLTSMYAARLMLGGESVPSGDFIRSILFFPYAGEQGLMRPVLGLGWTLNFEMFFYVTFLLAFLLPRPVGILVILAGGLLLAFSELLQLHIFAPLDLLTRPILGFFLAGIVIGHLSISNSARFGSMIANKLILGCVFLICAPLLASGLGFISTENAEICSGFTSILVVLIAAFGPSIPRTHPIDKLLVRIGDASYSLYLSHVLLISSFAYVMRRIAKHVDVGLFLYVALFCCVACLFSFLVYNAIEQKLTTRINSVFSRYLKRDRKATDG